MGRKAVAYILLAIMLATGTGLPQLVHAHVHHAPAGEQDGAIRCTSSCCSHALHANVDDEQTPSEQHGDDCAVCQFLALAAALPLTLVALCSLSSPAAENVLTLVSCVRSVSAPARASPRAPPLL